MGLERIGCALPGCGSYDKEQTNASVAARVTAIFLGTIITVVGILGFFVPQLHALGNIGSGLLIGIGTVSVLAGLFIKYIKDAADFQSGNKKVKQDADNILTQKDQPKEVDSQGVSEQWMRILRQYPYDNDVVEIESYKAAIQPFEEFIANEEMQTKTFGNTDFEQVRYVSFNEFSSKHGQGISWLRRFLTYLVLTHQIQGFSDSRGSNFRIELNTNRTFISEYSEQSLLLVDQGLQKIALPKKETFPLEQQEKIGKALKDIYKAHYWRLQGPTADTTILSFYSLFRPYDEKDTACLDNLVKRGVIRSWNVGDRMNYTYAKLSEDDQNKDAMISEKWHDLTIIKQLDQMRDGLPKPEEFPREQQEKARKVLEEIKKELYYRIVRTKPNNKVLDLGQFTCNATHELDALCLDNLVKKGVIHSWRSNGARVYLRISDTDDTAGVSYCFDKWRDQALIKEVEQSIAKLPKKEDFPNENSENIESLLHTLRKELFVRPQRQEPITASYYGKINEATLDALVKKGTIYAWDKDTHSYILKIAINDKGGKQNPIWRSLAVIQK